MTYSSFVNQYVCDNHEELDSTKNYEFLLVCQSFSVLTSVLHLIVVTWLFETANFAHISTTRGTMAMMFQSVVYSNTTASVYSCHQAAMISATELGYFCNWRSKFCPHKSGQHSVCYCPRCVKCSLPFLTRSWFLRLKVSGSHGVLSVFLCKVFCQWQAFAWSSTSISNFIEYIWFLLDWP